MMTKTIDPPGLLYISGPMTGYDQFNRPAFNAAREHLQAQGFSVIVPGDDEEHTIRERLAWRVEQPKRAAYMFRDFLHVLTANGVAVLEGWQDSPGSKAEVLVAQEIGLPVVWADTLEPVEAEVLTYAQGTTDDE
jgi:hypothetical protein